MASAEIFEEEPCKQSRKCSKAANHKGRCNAQKQVNPFWKSSTVYQLNTRKRNLLEEEKHLDEEYKAKSSFLNDWEEGLVNAELDVKRKLANKDEEISSLNYALQKSEAKAKALEEKLTVVTEKFEQVKTMVSSLGLDYKHFAKSKRENNSTTNDMINDFTSSTRYRRRKESENALKFIHGGERGSIYGAWDYIVGNAPKELVTDLIVGYKRGKHLEQIFSNAMKGYQMSAEAMKQAIATKYQNFLSRRKFNLVCKTQTSHFNTESDVWLPSNVKCIGMDLRLPQPVSNTAVDTFVKGLDIGDVNQLPGAPGISRTVTGLIYMIIDLHLRVPHLLKKLVWFNELENHFVIQFSDDGAPEISQLTMSIGSLTMWNLGDCVRTRDFQYLLHCVSLQEKHKVLEDLWIQHTDEMALLEGNILTIAGKQCTVEFQPSADMCWQSWANNELNQAATHPSPYANVHKGNINTLGGSIGFSASDTWKPYTNLDRQTHGMQVEKFKSSLKVTMSEKCKHTKTLEYMAEYGIRQLGPPRIGVFAERQRPELLHCEINAWQQTLSMIYLEFVQRNMFDCFIKVLAAPVWDPAREEPAASEEHEVPSMSGCGLSYLVPSLKEHYSDERKRHNKIPTRLIGDQAIALGRYGYRLIDSLKCDTEAPSQQIKRLVLGRVIFYLRNACAIFNKVSTSPAELLELDENCKVYFNLICLFFPSYVNVTCWTIAYALPYHASKLFDMYKVGYGIISQQAKEAKHSSVKNDLALSNRSNKMDSSGKWWQVIRANYVRSFYLPENQPMPCTYKSHFKSRVPPHCDLPESCECGRKKPTDSDYCQTCLQCREIVDCAKNQELSPTLIQVLLPHSCPVCCKCFADKVDLESHELLHINGTAALSNNKNPKTMSMAELKTELKKRNLSTVGKKDILVKRFENSLWVAKETPT